MDAFCHAVQYDCGHRPAGLWISTEQLDKMAMSRVSKLTDYWRYLDAGKDEDVIMEIKTQLSLNSSPLFT